MHEASASQVQEAHTDVIMLANSVRELVHKQRQIEDTEV